VATTSAQQLCPETARCKYRTGISPGSGVYHPKDKQRMIEKWRRLHFKIEQTCSLGYV
jgi:hypothetical protein